MENKHETIDNSKKRYENGEQVTLTCIGFRSLDDEICNKLSKKYQLYK